MIHLKPREDVVQRMRDRFEQIQWKGKDQPGVMAELDLNNLPNWLDRQQLEQSQEVLRDHSTSLSFASLSGLVLVLQVPAGFVPLVVSGKSESIPALFLRYLSTVTHVNDWYEHDLLDPESKAFKSISHVRRLHKHIFEVMQKSGIPCPEGFIWVSQPAMTYTQWAFAGLAFLYPRECGISGTDEEVFEILTHLNLRWRALGWMNGVTDENNMCSSDVEETIATCKLIFDHLYAPLLKAETPCNPLGLQMGLDIVTSMKSLSPVMTGEILLTYWAETFGFKIPYLRELTFFETFVYYSMCFSVKYLSGNSLLRKWHRQRTQSRLKFAQANRAVIYEKLKNKYPEKKYTVEKLNITPCGIILPEFYLEVLRDIRAKHGNNGKSIEWNEDENKIKNDNNNCQIIQL